MVSTAQLKLVWEDRFNFIASQNNRHPVLQAVLWHKVDARNEFLEHLANSVQDHLQTAEPQNNYRFNQHFIEVDRFLERQRREHPDEEYTSKQGNTRRRKAFLMACVAMAMLHFYPNECRQLIPNDFEHRFSQHIQHMPSSERTIANMYYQHLSLCLHLLQDPYKNELMLAECCALLCGISACMQGSNLGRWLTRLLEIRDEVLSSRTSASNISGSINSAVDTTTTPSHASPSLYTEFQGTIDDLIAHLEQLRNSNNYDPASRYALTVSIIPTEQDPVRFDLPVAASPLNDQIDGDSDSYMVNIVPPVAHIEAFDSTDDEQ